MKYKMPAKADLRGRSSTISNAFAISITPYITPSEEEIKTSYELLQLQEGQCAYCLGEGNGKDHLKPLVKMGMPTGYITAINNLVPCCSPCNSSKGAKAFDEWYLSDENVARLKRKGLSDSDIRKRFKIISEYERNIDEPLDYEALVGSELWTEFQTRRKALLDRMNEDQVFCDMLSSKIMKHLDQRESDKELSLSKIMSRIEPFKIGGADRRWKMKDEEITFENEYIKVVRIDSSNKWISSTEMVKQWGIIFKEKQNFTHLPNYRQLAEKCNITVTPVRSGRNAGCYGLRVYGMKKDPTAEIVLDILNFIFS